MLTIDHTERITAHEAINHEFFDEVRDSTEDDDLVSSTKIVNNI